MKINKRMLTALAIILGLLFIGTYYLIIHRRLQAPRWSLSSATLPIDGIDRHFSYYIPEGISRQPALVFVLHGSKGTVNIMRYLTDYEFEKIASHRKDFILVYPQGFDRHWNDCRASATYRAKRENIDDIAFFREMITYLSDRYGADRQAVFATGYSNGGHMCLKLAYELPEAFRGIAPIAANLPDVANNDCIRKDRPVSVLFVNGTADPVNPYNGGLVVLKGDSSRGRVYSTAESGQYWIDLLPGAPKTERIPYDAPRIEHFRTISEDGRYKVEVVSVKEGGHTIPLRRPAPYLPGFIGATNRNLHAPDLVIDFFENLK
ncbi:alpha/beta hydrolase family esterase [Flavilitoribacter nigricans]|nr:poly(3-hydroxybutyrate) depolymerase [Flavilitoribacter nigricans]